MRPAAIPPIIRLLRLLVREAWCLAVSQPHRLRHRRLRRLDVWRDGPAGVPVVFVHGYAQNSATFRGMARGLVRRGAGPLYGFNYWCFDDVQHIARRLDRFIERVCAETGSEHVDLVSHSMGGLVAAEHLMRTDGSNVRRCVTIATPHAGVTWRGPILGDCRHQLRHGCDYLLGHYDRPFPVPLLNIVSEHDTLFFPPDSAAVRRRGGWDIVLEDHGHLSLLFADDVIDIVHHFLDGAPPHALPGFQRRTSLPPPPPTPLADAAE